MLCKLNSDVQHDDMISDTLFGRKTFFFYILTPWSYDTLHTALNSFKIYITPAKLKHVFFHQCCSLRFVCRYTRKKLKKKIEKYYLWHILQKKNVSFRNQREKKYQVSATWQPLIKKIVLKTFCSACIYWRVL